MSGRRCIEKQLSYRVPLAAGQEEQRLRQTADHWAGFQWDAGRTIVEWNSEAHGVIQVWAIDEAEGLGVIEHALIDVGAELKDGQVFVSFSRSSRNGRLGTVRVGEAEIRNGSSGPALKATLL